MIGLTRRRIRELGRLLRRGVLGLSRSGPAPPIVLRGLGPAGGVRVRWSSADLALETVACGLGRNAGEVVVLPLDALAELEGRDDSPVTLEASPSGVTLVRWSDRGVPRAAVHRTSEIADAEPFPETPTSLVPAPSGLREALAEATRVTTGDSTRYALDHVQLRGGPDGSIAATDGRQLLVHGGLSLPWDDDLLVRRVPLLTARDWLRGRPVLVGRTETHIALRAGPWTAWLPVRADARFPRVDGLLPDEATATTTVEVDPDDAAFLLERLAALPVDAHNAPITLDVGDHVVVRAARADGGRLVELVLTRSRFRGAPTRLATDRRFLARCLGLGGRTLFLAGPTQPIAGRRDAVTYGWLPLDRDAARGPSDDAVTIRSDRHEAIHPTPITPIPTRRTMPDVPIANGINPGRPAIAKPASDGEFPPLDPIAEAEALHAALADARGRSARLLAALRRQRRQERLVLEAMRSIRRLGPADAAG